VEGIIAVAVTNLKAHNKIHINGAEAIEANSELFFVKKRGRMKNREIAV
jgi:hypothetical protein